MAKRDLSLTERKENLRDAKPILLPVHFSLSEIWKHFNDSIEAVSTQYKVADSLAASGDIDGCKDIWRSQVVFAEGILDFYIHEISKYCLFRMYVGRWEKSDKYKMLMVPMEKVEEAIDAAESNEWFFEYLNSRFSRDVFISKESMKDQLNLIGIEYGKTMVKAFPRDKDEMSIKDGSSIVEELFRRRNQIAHQNDRSHLNAEKSDIKKEYVIDYISKIVSIAGAIYKIAKAKDEFYKKTDRD